MLWMHVLDALYWLPLLVLVGSTLLLLFLVVAISRGFFRQALLSWSWRRILFFASMSFREQRLLASMQAEELVEAALHAAGWRHVFLRRRVRVQRLGCNREIDVVAVGPVVLVVEVKNWRGQVWCNGQRWFQCPGSGRRALEFEDVQEDNLMKAAALRRFIENDRRIALPDHSALTNDAGENSAGAEEEGGASGAALREHGTWYTDRRLHKQCGKLVVPVVVFTNPDVVLDPNTVRTKKRVFDLPSFQEYAAQLMRDLRGASSFIASVNEISVRLLRHVLFFSPSPSLLSLSLAEEKRVSAAVATLRTWDMIYLHSGCLLHGDVTELELPSVQRKIERKHVLYFEIKWFNGVKGFLQSLWFGGSGVVRVRLGASQRLAMKRDEIVLPIKQGNRKHGWLNDRLVIMLAGSKTTKTVALADILKAQFSQHLEY